MFFDTENPIVKLCTLGMDCEGQGDAEGAARLFSDAWQKAESDYDKMIAAHYRARHQPLVKDKLAWDKIALEHALKIKGRVVKSTYPSLYLNIGKCYEDLQDPQTAAEYYRLAMSFVEFLEKDGYGKFIRTGVLNALRRVDA